jgi:PAS domain S-box-containing protein
MIWQYSPYFVPYIACGLILFILGITGWKNRTYVCARSYTVLMFAAGIWAFCTALELASADLPTQMLAITLEYPPMAIIPVAWLLFALEYTGRDELITAKTVGLLCIVPAFTTIMVATNPFHYLFYSIVTITNFLGLSYHTVTYGPAFWVHAIYSYLIIGTALLLILQRFLFSSSLYRKQVTIILIATLIPLVMNLILVFRIGSVGLIDPTPVALLASGILIMIGMVRFQLLDITPIAHEQILAHMRDGVIVIDIQDRIISLNAPASRFLGIPLETAIGISVADNLPGTAIECLRSHGHSFSGEQRLEAERVIEGKTRFFEMRCIPIRTRNTSDKGRMILIRDITESRQTQVALSEARRRITLLSSFTRHDILNQVTALLLNIDIAKESSEDPAIQEWLKKQEAAVLTIQRQIEFTRDYEELGTKAPEWLSVRDIFSGTRESLAGWKIVFEGIEDDLEIFADPLLRQAFSHLVDNSIQHGERVTKIRITYEKTETGLTLVFEDNGIGIAAAEKIRIFERGVGRQTGLGLFLVHEILGVTGMTIRECGEPGKGARFEIQVPAGQFRISP